MRLLGVDVTTQNEFDLFKKNEFELLIEKQKRLEETLRNQINDQRRFVRRVKAGMVALVVMVIVGATLCLAL